MYETFYKDPQQGLKTGLNVEDIRQALSTETGLLWIDMWDIDDGDIDLLTEVFNLHSLTIEDFIMPNIRSKVENFKDYLFLILFAMDSADKTKGKINTSELDCCLGNNFLITTHNNGINVLSTIKERVRRESPIMKNSSDFLLYSILDYLVDSYLPIISEFDAMVDEMSDELFKDPSNETLKKIYLLKNEIMYLRRTVGPQADIMSLIARGEFSQILPSNTVYFRNLYDNLVRLNDIVGTSRDVVTGAMEAYVSVVSNRLNEVMKTLTIITTTMMPLTLIASIYGMNFKYMPELSHKFGYPMVISFMLIIMVFMVIFFKRKRWI
ncbi:MAG: magnesium/cobalt transporter CorA [Candidatus Omnitrophica bacterium]|nr:magnesium/cobalt transporter CorA [Candidatus Omnitrophota bacterium]